MSSYFPPAIVQACDAFYSDIWRNIAVIAEDLDFVGTAIGHGTGIVAYGVSTAFSGIGHVCVRIGTKVARFVKNNWHQLVAYIIAWGVIVAASGLMYGFNAVALPLTIGMAGGLGGGIIAAIYMVKNDPVGKTSFWNLLNTFVELTQTMKPIVTAVSVTLLLAAAVVYPYVIGAFFGILIGNQLTVKIATDQELGPDPKEVDAKVKAHEEAIKKNGMEAQQVVVIMKSCEEILLWCKEWLVRHEQAQWNDEYNGSMVAEHKREMNQTLPGSSASS